MFWILNFSFPQGCIGNSHPLGIHTAHFSPGHISFYFSLERKRKLVPYFLKHVWKKEQQEKLSLISVLDMFLTSFPVQSLSDLGWHLDIFFFLDPHCPCVEGLMYLSPTRPGAYKFLSTAEFTQLIHGTTYLFLQAVKPIALEDPAFKISSQHYGTASSHFAHGSLFWVHENNSYKCHSFMWANLKIIQGAKLIRTTTCPWNHALSVLLPKKWIDRSKGLLTNLLFLMAVDNPNLNNSETILKGYSSWCIQKANFWNQNNLIPTFPEIPAH